MKSLSRRLSAARHADGVATATMSRRGFLINAIGGSLLGACGAPRHRKRVRVSAISVPGTPWHDMWVRFEERAAALADDRFIVELFVLAQFGPEENMISNLRRNRIQIAGLSLQGAAPVVPELNVLLAPFLFDSQDELDFCLDNALLQPYSRLLEARGLTILQWADVGWTHIYGREPLIEPDDVRGRRMRTSRAAGARAFGRALGMNQIILPFTDLIPALQTGLVDGGQTGIGMYALAGISREAPHLTLTAHAYDAGLIAANADWWHGLDDEVRRRIRMALDPVEQTRDDVRRMIAEFEAELHADPAVAVHTLHERQRQAWRAASAGAAEALVEQIGGQAEMIYQLIQASKAEFARRLSTPGSLSDLRDRSESSGKKRPVLPSFGE